MPCIRDVHKALIVDRNADDIAAQAVGKSYSALGAFHRRLKSRLGPAKATTATTRNLAYIFYGALRYGMQYADPGVEYYERKYRERTLNNLKRRARQLGYELVEEQELTPALS